jgi:1,2-diacylglycerol 3-alpha-glucosyltransferase
MRIAVIFDNFGPYHLARLTAASHVAELLGVEISGRSSEYAWAPVAGVTEFQRTTLLPQATSESAHPGLLAVRMYEVLSAFRPEAVAIPGWSSRAALLALRWCVEKRVPAVLMSESQARDEPRSYFREWLKRRVLRAFRAALVGGRPHQEYLMELGMEAGDSFVGYDAVDNEYFAQGAAAARSNACETRSKLNLPKEYFLAANRFVPKKNLPFLLRAYARYLAGCRSDPWKLVLLGDGPLRADVEALVEELGIADQVVLPGFRQYDELPVYYGLAGAFVHASTTEQWGLVVNEAMASGLPVLVSNRCGCAAELVRDGENGFQFDPLDEDALARHMAAIAGSDERRRSMGRASLARIGEWGPNRFAAGLRQAVECALRVGPPPQRPLDGLILRLLAARTG